MPRRTRRCRFGRGEGGVWWAFLQSLKQSSQFDQGGWGVREDIGSVEVKFFLCKPCQRFRTGECSVVCRTGEVFFVVFIGCRSRISSGEVGYRHQLDAVERGACWWVKRNTGAMRCVAREGKRLHWCICAARMEPYVSCLQKSSPCLSNYDSNSSSRSSIVVSLPMWRWTGGSRSGSARCWVTLSS